MFFFNCGDRNVVKIFFDRWELKRVFQNHYLRFAPYEKYGIYKQ